MALTMQNIFDNTDAVELMLKGMNDRQRQQEERKANNQDKKWLTFFIEEGKPFMYHQLWPLSQALSLPVHNVYIPLPNKAKHPDNIFPPRICKRYYEGQQCEYCEKGEERAREEEKNGTPREDCLAYKWTPHEYTALPVFGFNAQFQFDKKGVITGVAYDEVPSEESGRLMVMFEKTPQYETGGNYIYKLVDALKTAKKVHQIDLDLCDPMRDYYLTRGRSAKNNQTEYDLNSFKRTEPFDFSAVDYPKNKGELLRILTEEKYPKFVSIVDQMILAASNGNQPQSMTKKVPESRETVVLNNGSSRPNKMDISPEDQEKLNGFNRYQSIKKVG